MSYLGGSFDFTDGARLTGIMDPRRDVGALLDGLVTAHRVVLPDDEHAVTEEGFAIAHLPLAVIGIEGRDPDGSEWFVVFQAACPSFDAPGRGTDEEVTRLLDASLRRALSMNPRASVADEIDLSVGELREAYTDHGIAAEDVAGWTADDLVRGLIAEMTGTALADLVADYDAGCAFPGTPHKCRGDVFSDVFGQWSAPDR